MMSDSLLIQLTRAKHGLQWLAHLAQYQSPQAADYVGQAVIKLEAALQQIELERKQVAEPVKECGKVIVRIG